MQLVDTHAHLHFEAFKDSIDQVLDQAKLAGVSKVITVGCSLADSQQAVDLANDQPMVWAAVGAHPHDGQDFFGHQNSPQILTELLKKPKVVAIGEIGLDYFHSHTEPKVQKKALQKQIELGLECGLPFIFHIREAFDDFWPIFDQYKGANIRGVVHSFSAHLPQLEQILERDLYVGLNGIMTFTKDEKQLQAAKAVPIEKLLLETDAPFLTPKPFRGTMCESKHVALTAEFIANLRMTPLEALASATTSNADKLFSLV